MKTLALIEKGKDGTFGIYTPDINATIIGSGNTIADAKADFEKSLHEVINAYRDAHEPLPAELQDIEIEYKYPPA